MLTHVFHGSQIAFFELAATLIPVFLLGGIITERMLPKDDDSYLRIATHVGFIPTFGTLGLLAEFISISAVASGDSSEVSRWFVSAFLAGSMAGVVVLLWLPWLGRLRQTDPANAQLWKRLFGWSVIPMTIIGTLLLGQGVHNGAAIEAANNYEDRYERSSAERVSVERHIAALTVDAGRVDAQVAAAKARHAPKVVLRALRRGRRQIRELLAVALVEKLEISRELKRLHP